MRFDEFYKGLSEAEQEAYCAAASIKPGYVRTHLIAPKSRRKIPREDTLDNLVSASSGAFTKAELLAYFYELDAA